MKKAIITVVGKDKVGIIANVSVALAACEANILDINQTILQEYFTMMMLVDIEGITVSYEDFIQKMDDVSKTLGMSIRVQLEDVFRAMHRI